MSEKKGRKARRAVFTVRNMDCATCGLAIEKKLRKVDGVEGVVSAIMLNKIFVDYDESRLSVTEIRKAIKDTGYSSYVTNDDSTR